MSKRFAFAKFDPLWCTRHNVLAVGGSVLRYALIPAPPYPGAEPRFEGGVGSIDVGAVAFGGSSAEFVERIVQRVRPGQ